MKSTAKKGIRIWFCVVNGKRVYRSFRASESRTFTRSFNKVMKGRARCRIESRVLIEAESA